MSETRTSIRKKLEYKTAIVDRAFLNKFVDSLKAPLEIESIGVTCDIAKIQGSDINEILDKVVEGGTEISYLSIDAAEKWDSNEHLQRERKRIELLSSDYEMTITIRGDDIDWVNGKEKSIDSIVNRGTRRHRLFKNEKFAIGTSTAGLILFIVAYVFLRMENPPSSVAYISWVIAILGLILLVFMWTLLITSFKKRVIITPVNLEEESQKKESSPRERKQIIWQAIITISGGLLVALIIELIRNLWK